MCKRCKPNHKKTKYEVRHYKKCWFCGCNKGGWEDGQRRGSFNGEWVTMPVAKRQPKHCNCNPCQGCGHLVFRDPTINYFCNDCGDDNKNTVYFRDNLRDGTYNSRFYCLDCYRNRMTKWVESIAPKPQPAQLVGTR